MSPTTKTNLPKQLEGTWEEILTHSDELAGRRVKVIILTEETESSLNEAPTPKNRSTAASLLQNAMEAGTWSGDDFEECLQMVYDYRGKF